MNATTVIVDIMAEAMKVLVSDVICRKEELGTCGG